MTKLPSPANRILGLAALAALLAPASAQGLASLHGEVVLGSGQAPPTSGGIATDFLPGAVIGLGSSFFAAPSLDLNGTLLFRARCNDDGALQITQANGWAFYMGRTAADLRMIVRGSDQAPGMAPGILLRGSSASVNGIQAMRISPLNEFLMLAASLFDGNVTVTTANDSALFWGSVGGLQPIAREGDLVPTLTNGEIYGAMVNSNQDFLLNANGKTVFRNTLVTGTGGVTSSNDAIVMQGTLGNLQVLAREGDQWTGVGAAGEIIDRFATNGNSVIISMNLNEAGHVLHDIHFVVGSGSATSTANDRAVVIWNGTADQIVAREGDQAPGLPAGALFTDVSAFSSFASIQQNGFNKSSQFVLTATPVGGGLTPADDNCLFMGSLTTPLTLILREGDPAPASMGPGVFFGTVNSTVQLNDAGQLAFFASVTGAGVTSANDQCLFTGTPGNWTLVAREGDAAPGIPGFFLGAVQAGAVSLDQFGDIQFGSVTITDNGSPTPITRLVQWSWTAEHGLRALHDPIGPMTLPLGTTTLNTSFSSAGSIQSGDSGSVMFNGNGDVGMVIAANTSESLGAAVVRTHIGSFLAKPSAVPVAGGVPQNFLIDVGPNYANTLYLVLATGLGTRPGFVSPLGPQTVPLNFDGLWTNLSLNAANTPIWVNSVGFLDANGKNLFPAAFVMPPGYPSFTGFTIHHSALVIDGNLVSQFATEPSALKFY